MINNSQILKDLESKVIISEVPKDSEVKVKSYPRKTVWKKSKPYYKAKAQSKKKLYKSNLRGPIKLWLPKNEIIFATGKLKGKNKATVASGQWLLATFNKKIHIPNPNSKRGMRCGI